MLIKVQYLVLSRRYMAAISNTFGSAAEPPVEDIMGPFQVLSLPVTKTPSSASWSTSDEDYYTPQTQEEHDELLNTYYNTRAFNPAWKQLGEEEEQNSKHYSDKDSTFRNHETGMSNVIEGIEYDPNNNYCYLTIGGKQYQYMATPDQLKAFLTAGSLGQEMNRIKHGQGYTMTKV